MEEKRTPPPESSPIKGEEQKRNSPPLVGGVRGGGDNQSGTWSALSLAWELGYTIAIPIVVFALAGRWLDRRLDTAPWLLLTGIFISLVVSSWLVYFKMIKIIGK